MDDIKIYKVNYVYKDGSKRYAQDISIKADGLFEASEKFFDTHKGYDFIFVSFDRIC